MKTATVTMQGTMDDLIKSLVIVKGTSKKNGKDYTMLAVSRRAQWDNFTISLADQMGVRTIDVRPNGTRTVNDRPVGGYVGSDDSHLEPVEAD